MSREDNGRVIEYAGRAAGGSGISDAEIRERARNAPAWVKRSMDASRARRGLRPLWGESDHTPEPPRRKQIKAWTLVGCVAPGTSVPVAAATDGLRLPERIAPMCFERSLRTVEAREAFIDLQDGHGGRTLASTSDGTLLLRADPVVGLIVEAHLPHTTENQKLFRDAAMGKVGLSVGVRPYRVGIERDANGKRVRVIYEGSLHHIALIRPGRGTPAYPSRVRMYPCDSKPDAARHYAAVLDGLRTICKQDGLL